MPEASYRRAGACLAGFVVWIGLGAAPVCAHPDPEFLEGAVDELLVRHPDDPELILKQGRLREMARDWDGALVAIEHARDHGAAPEVVAASRGRVFRAAGFLKMAKLEYDRALVLRPDGYELLFERGRVQLGLGRPEEADADFARAIDHMTSPRPEHVIERRDALLARGRTAEALAAIDAGIKRLGPIVSLELPAIDLELELGHPDGALVRIDRLLAQVPRNGAWIARRGEILANAGRHAEAQTEFTRALAILRERPEARPSPANTELEARVRAALATEEHTTRGNP